MNKKIFSTFIILLIMAGIFSAKAFSQTEIEKKLNAYKTVKLVPDLSYLSEKDKSVIPILIEIAEIMDDIFWLQAYGDKNSLLGNIKDKATKDFLMINYGPWERLNGNEPFIEGFGVKPLGANYYPIDMSKEEFEKFDHKDKKSLYTVIRRDSEGKLICVPFYEEYKSQHQKAAELMLKASEMAEDEGFKKYLKLRADALLTNNYQPSDIAWMEMKT